MHAGVGRRDVLEQRGDLGVGNVRIVREQRVTLPVIGVNFAQHDHAGAAGGEVLAILRVGKKAQLIRRGGRERADAADVLGAVAAQGQAEALGERRERRRRGCRHGFGGAGFAWRRRSSTASVMSMRGLA